MFRELSMEHIDGYSKLSTAQKDLFDTTYKRHLASMSLEKQKNYAENKIQKIEAEMNILKVFFANGDCYIYLHKNRWIKIT